MPHFYATSTGQTVASATVEDRVQRRLDRIERTRGIQIPDHADRVTLSILRKKNRVSLPSIGSTQGQRARRFTLPAGAQEDVK